MGIKKGKSNMKYYLVIVESYYINEFIIPVMDGKSVEKATDLALSEIGFCDDYTIGNYEEVNTDYMKALCLAQKAYLELTGHSVMEDFTSGKYATYAEIMMEICRMKKGE